MDVRLSERAVWRPAAGADVRRLRRPPPLHPFGCVAARRSSVVPAPRFSELSKVTGICPECGTEFDPVRFSVRISDVDATFDRAKCAFEAHARAVREEKRREASLQLSQEGVQATLERAQPRTG
jgi:hypothetical protein